MLSSLRIIKEVPTFDHPRFQIVAGTALSGGLSSLLFTKLIRPNRHVSSVGFSRKAAVSYFNILTYGNYYFIQKVKTRSYLVCVFALGVPFFDAEYSRLNTCIWYNIRHYTCKTSLK